MVLQSKEAYHVILFINIGLLKRENCECPCHNVFNSFVYNI